MGKLSFLLIASLVLFLQPANSDEFTNYPDIPRIDVHTHITSDLDAIANYHLMREALKKNHHADLAVWINLGGGADPMEDNQEA
ncbi:hypothetical protein K8I31_18230, partial [bacterium]|nr:hypothetical protein [bacterium]